MTDEGQLPPGMIGTLPGARGAAWVERLARSECPALTARRARRGERSGAPHDPIVWVRARGSNVWDTDGNRYVDLSAGFGAACLGHGHPALLSALHAQSERLVHALGDLHPSDVKIELCERLAALSPWKDARVMLGLSGSDAVTAALKTAALATGRPGVLAFEGGYHGLSYGPLAACGYSEAFRAPFAEQSNPHVRFAPFPHDEAALSRALDVVARQLDARVGAVLVEPVQGRGGVIVPPATFLPELAALCRARGALLITDEVLTAMGRTGEQWPSPLADLVCLGKALGGGLPISACLGRDALMRRAWGDPAGAAIHTGTFFGHPLGCAAALSVLAVVERQALGARAAELGARLLSRLGARLGARVTALRGAGLLVGIELADGARSLRVMRRLLERGYITVPAGADARVISLTPALDIEEPLLHGFVEALAAVLEDEA